MAKFRKKAVIIEAVQIDKEQYVDTLEGRMHGSVGDWLITGVKGEQYFCKPDIFLMTYEPATEGKPLDERIFEFQNMLQEMHRDKLISEQTYLKILDYGFKLNVPLEEYNELYADKEDK